MAESKPKTIERDEGDLGVAMLPGDPDERQGPEDALGPGAKRGDYRSRVGPPEYHPHAGSEPQRPRAEKIADEKALKGGVDTEGDR